MVQPLDQAAYSEQVHGLLPTGRAWATGVGTRMARLVAAFSSELARVDTSLTALLNGALPDHATDLLPDWERVAGLPDSCSGGGLADDVLQRRAAVIEKIVTKANLNPATFVATARRYGVDIDVIEFDQPRAEAVQGLDTSGGRWRYVWWIKLPAGKVRRFHVLSTVNTPLRTIQRSAEIECRLRKLNPAHMLLLFIYDVAPVLPALPDISGYRNVNVEYTLPEAAGGNGALTYALSPDVPGMTFTPASRVWDGAPTAVADTEMTYTATDEDGDVATRTFEHSVAAPPALTLPAVADFRHRHLENLTKVFPAATGGVEPYTYSLGPAVSHGGHTYAGCREMTFSSATRTWSGTYWGGDPTGTTRRNVNIVYSVVDAAGQRASQTATVTTT